MDKNKPPQQHESTNKQEQQRQRHQQNKQKTARWCTQNFHALFCGENCLTTVLNTNRHIYGQEQTATAAREHKQTRATNGRGTNRTSRRQRWCTHNFHASFCRENCLTTNLNTKRHIYGKNKQPQQHERKTNKSTNSRGTNGTTCAAERHLSKSQSTR